MVSSMLKVAQQQQQHQPVMTQAPPQLPLYTTVCCGHSVLMITASARSSFVDSAVEIHTAGNDTHFSPVLSAMFAYMRSQPNMVDASITGDIASTAAAAAAASGTGGSALARSDSSTEAAAAAATDADSSSSSKQKKQKVKQPCANANCGQLTTKLCRRCATVHYCSIECQKVCFKDRQHRAQCIELASAIV
eukprot:16282-Heterococcus_DN1.PRE.1